VPDSGSRLPIAGALAANALILGILVVCGALATFEPDLHYQSMQEDELLEWCSFWAFFLAALVLARPVLSRREPGATWPWLTALMSLACFVIAMEEVSWGQRFLGFRPPEYFLAHNYQQELNVHNVMSSESRALSFAALAFGFGVVLPLLARIPPLARLLGAAGMIPPPVALAPSFLAAGILQEVYPWRFTGEVAELMLGGSLLFSGLVQLPARPRGEPREPGLPRLFPVLLATCGVLGLGLASSWASRSMATGDPEANARARREAEALRTDFLEMAARNGDQPVTDCELSKRIYTYVVQYRKPELGRGAFAGLAGPEMPAARAEYFLDPWNSPWWIRDTCDEDTQERRIFVYSFGPNRRRDSSRWELQGDDVGARIFDGSMHATIIKEATRDDPSVTPPGETD
jgi:hypothetical protein